MYESGCGEYEHMSVYTTHYQATVLRAWVVTGSTENGSRDRLRGLNAPKNNGFSGIGRFAGVDDCSISKFL